MTTQDTRQDTRTVVIERELPHKPEKIWRALTQGALIKEWLMTTTSSLSSATALNSAPPRCRTGRHHRLRSAGDRANKKLSYSWGSMGLESVVIWTLTTTGGGTLLRMEQSGFRADQEAAYRGATYGWQKFIGNLEGVLAKL